MKFQNSEKIIAETPFNTVIAEFKSVKKKGGEYQYEDDLEKDFINRLKLHGYEYLKIKSDDDLKNNLRKQLEKLNSIEFTDKEWSLFLENEICNPNYGVKEKSKTIHKDYIKGIKRENGESRNIHLIKKDGVGIYDNNLQVMQQFSQKGEKLNRYDVTILVNGLPLVHIELKIRGEAIENAFNQIERYKEESFWSKSAFFENIQIFVISNGVDTRYYSNTSRYNKLEKNQKTQYLGKSYSFTMNWADQKNTPIRDIEDFTEYFFPKRCLLEALTKYCVLTVDEDLKVMRPYQITATEKIIQKAKSQLNQKTFNGKGGYIWHTTGSGKTLTSFKVSQLLAEDKRIYKVLFVVDRMDLDHQTRIEYNKFQEGSADSTDNTRVLQKQLENNENRKKIIVTTIQKLTRFIQKNKSHPIYDRNIILIFDECHRSQFGEMHEKIVKTFKRYILFGFTGTPIFKENANTNKQATLNKTTMEVFGERLHQYTIVDAIKDENVLGFSVDDGKTVDISELEGKSDKEINELYSQEGHINSVVDYIMKWFHTKTLRDKESTVLEQREKGFNSLLATSSKKSAMNYYERFKYVQAEVDEKKRLNIAIIFSSTNEKMSFSGLTDETPDTIQSLNEAEKVFLNNAIEDYNRMFETSFDLSSQSL